MGNMYPLLLRVSSYLFCPLNTPSWEPDVTQEPEQCLGHTKHKPIANACLIHSLPPGTGPMVRQTWFPLEFRTPCSAQCHVILFGCNFFTLPLNSELCSSARMVSLIFYFAASGESLQVDKELKLCGCVSQLHLRWNILVLSSHTCSFKNRILGPFYPTPPPHLSLSL